MVVSWRLILFLRICWTGSRRFVLFLGDLFCFKKIGSISWWLILFLDIGSISWRSLLFLDDWFYFLEIDSISLRWVLFLDLFYYKEIGSISRRGKRECYLPRDVWDRLHHQVTIDRFRNIKTDIKRVLKEKRLRWTEIEMNLKRENPISQRCATNQPSLEGSQNKDSVHFLLFLDNCKHWDIYGPQGAAKNIY